MTQNNTVGFYRHLAMTLPSQSQFDSALTKTDLAEIFKCRKIRTTGALLRIRSSREAAAARQPRSNGTTSFSTASTSLIAPRVR